MKKIVKFADRLRGLTNAIARYPLTAAFLLAAAVTVAIAVNTEKDYGKQLMSCAVGAVLCAALQAAWERFFIKRSARLILMGCGAALTAGYYLLIGSAPELGAEAGIRTSVALLALVFAFIWVPVIQSRITFNESFMAVFKAFFHSVFYSAVLFGGCSLIIAAINRLIVNVSEKAYPHTANIVFVLFAPIFFLSLIPFYPGKKDRESGFEKITAQDEDIGRAVSCPKFLEVLISYIIIPLTAVFTVILVLYIVLNIRGEFWTNNLLEPMLVSYAITVILVCILSGRLENKFAALFRLIFPKVLVPIVLFQIVSSVISLQDTGVTHTKYFVILFGVFAASAGVVMSTVPVRKNGIIAAMLIAFSAVSVIPPADAFTVSRLSQENMLKTVLVKNGMLKNNAVIPNGSVSGGDQKKIVFSVGYLEQMGYLGKIAWLPEHFTAQKDFYSTFGFDEYDLPEKTGRPVNVIRNTAMPLDIAGYDILAQTYVNCDESVNSNICEIKKSGKNYVLKKVKTGGQYDVVLTDESNREIILFHTDEIFSRYRGYTAEKSEISNEEAAFSAENDRAKITFVVQSANIESSADRTYCYADLSIMVRIK